MAVWTQYLNLALGLWLLASTRKTNRGFDSEGRNSYHCGMKTTVSEKGQITIPKRLRDRLGIRSGQELELHEEAGRIVATKAIHEDRTARVYGILKPGRPTDRLIEELRGKADKT
ncbi:MAG: AbrB/MazE/SpoVT family DNA-binding domain-containing protein [Thermoleophilaceae bacterium]